MDQGNFVSRYNTNVLLYLKNKKGEELQDLFKIIPAVIWEIHIIPTKNGLKTKIFCPNQNIVIRPDNGLDITMILEGCEINFSEGIVKEISINDASFFINIPKVLKGILIKETEDSFRIVHGELFF